MLFEWSKDKAFRRSEFFYATFNNLLFSVGIGAMLYALCNLLLIFDVDIDPTDIKYCSVFIAIAIVVFIVLTIFRYRNGKGVLITDNTIYFSTGYRTKIYWFNNTIMRDDIINVERMDNFKLSEILKSDWRNYNYTWLYVGGKYVNGGLVKVELTENRVFLFPVEKVDEMVAYLRG